MNWTIKLLFYLSLYTGLFGSDWSIRESYNALFHSRSSTVHATLHVNNLIRHGVENLANNEKTRLSEIGLSYQEDQIIILKSNTLDQSYDTEHFRFYYTLDSTSNDAVENVEYVTTMASIYENVWSFQMDSLGFDSPPVNPNNDHDLYEINIEYLPSNYFAITYGDGSGSSCYSTIKMRNSYTASQFSDHSEIENIQVTASHEFFHAIQFGYNCYEAFWFMEASATWTEDELFNDINDFYRYIPNFFLYPEKAINTETSFMYGTCILFQYIDEHLGGRETIRNTWNFSRDMANPSSDISYKAIDAALNEVNSSLESAVTQMRVANQILSSSTNAGLYTYEEADGYLTVVYPPPKTDYLIFEKGKIQTILNSSLRLYSSHYYSLYTDAPITLNLSELSGHFSLTSVVKINGEEKWVVKHGHELNIDPKIGIEWIVIIVSAKGEEDYDWEYSLQLTDGYSEDFTLYPPYPNPSFGSSIQIDFQVISEQTIQFRIVDIKGREIWNYSQYFPEPTVTQLSWTGKNKLGHPVANGIYFGIMKGNSKTSIYKITYLKK